MIYLTLAPTSAQQSTYRILKPPSMLIENRIMVVSVFASVTGYRKPTTTDHMVSYTTAVHTELSCERKDQLMVTKIIVQLARSHATDDPREEWI